MQFVSDGAAERDGGGKEGSGICLTLFKECSVTHMSVCPGAYSMEWKGSDGRVLSLPLSLFLFLSPFPVYFAGLTSLSPHSGAEQKLNAVLSIALNHAMAI